MKLSIIIPTFNRASLLSEAVDSILCQQPAIHEIVIIDDASQDDTLALCSQLQQFSSETQLVIARNKQNAGAQVSRNKGLQLSTGELVMFMDSDDVLAAQGIAKFIEQFQKNPQLDYVYGKVVKTDANLHPLDPPAVVGAVFSSAPVDVAGYHWHTMGAIYRKTYLQKVGYWNEQLTGSQDWEFQARVKLAGGQGQFIDHTVGFWREHSSPRVGAKKFRLDYVESVIEACLSIHKQAKQLDRLDDALERRLVKKLLLHTLELSVNGYSLERQNYMKQALSILCFNLPIKVTIRTLLFLQSTADPVLWRVFSPSS